ncbi:hypothetical protein ZWY2020_057685 [Hordeum vulgare]|nr:hypothetical protein ZWY2020_057685 [Hordeum vulgare]
MEKHQHGKDDKTDGRTCHGTRSASEHIAEDLKYVDARTPKFRSITGKVAGEEDADADAEADDKDIYGLPLKTPSPMPGRRGEEETSRVIHSFILLLAV